MTVKDFEMPEKQASSGRLASQAARLKLLLRILGIFLPIALFGAAILVGLVFWVTLMPVLGTIAVVLTIAATISAILAAFILIEP
jgi:uncharacterized membrane protein